MNDVNKICICGHKRNAHKCNGENGTITIPEYGEHWCDECSRENGSVSFHTFKLDNLKYLEQLYEAKNGKIIYR